MLLSLLLATSLIHPVPPANDPTVHSGRQGQVKVRVPRLEGSDVVDGKLDEPMWSSAALLTGFSQYTPVDGVPAADSTEVLVWYSPKALHIGIRAYDSSGAVHATLANRDQIFSDDNIQIFLSTFNDGRQATVLAVNPLGVQADGALNESGRQSCNGFNCAMQTREPVDLSQDFVWESKGRLTSSGYEVEITVPFKSIRFQDAKTQSWGINVLRTVQRSGQEQTWTPARRGAASFLGQSGALEGLSDLDAGHVLDLIPTVTSRVTGGAASSGSGWNYGGGAPEFGGTLRYGITPNLTLNATANPDFSQVESDVGQFSFDPRQAIAFPERRPFFLDGIEQFSVPGNLVYTRRIVQPIFASKLTGKLAGTQVAALGAVDDQAGSRHGDHPVYGIVRLSRDLGPGSRLGMLWTEQHDGPDLNRVLDMDGRIVVGRIHAFSGQAALAHDDRGGVVHNDPIWNVNYTRSGRAFQSRYGLTGIGTNFRTASGFVSQPGIAVANFSNSFTLLRQGGVLEALSSELVLQGRWGYDDFVHGRSVRDRFLHINFNATLRGGWNAGFSVLDENFGYDPSLYANYGLKAPDGSVRPFVGQPRIPNRDYVLQVGTPTWRTFSLGAFVLWGHDENFYEWSSADLVTGNVGLLFRPTDQLRANVSVNYQTVDRHSDGTRVDLQLIPRVRLEYQLSRAFQLRLVTQYTLDSRDSLRDDSRTGLPIVVRNASGAWIPTVPTRNGNLRSDLLFSYLPTPGTVIYFGYGASYHEPDAFDRRVFTRTQDGFFLKLSYLWRYRG